MNSLIKKTVSEKKLQGKVILITGASSGIGRATALELADSHTYLILVARSEDLLVSLKEELEENHCHAYIFVADLVDENDRNRLISWVLDKFDGIDVLFNNAGVSIRREVLGSLDKDQDITKTLALNYIAPVSLMKAFIPRMIARGGGQIINSSTGAVIYPIPRFSAYAASKSALSIYSEITGIELRDKGIICSNIFFPLVKTPMTDKTGVYKETKGLLCVDKAAEEVKRVMSTGRTRSTFRLWIGEFYRIIFNNMNTLYINTIFTAYESQTNQRPKLSVSTLIIRSIWKKSPF